MSCSELPPPLQEKPGTYLNWRKPENGVTGFSFVQILSPLTHLVGGRSWGENICDERIAATLSPTVCVCVARGGGAI